MCPRVREEMVMRSVRRMVLACGLVVVMLRAFFMPGSGSVVLAQADPPCPTITNGGFEDTDGSTATGWAGNYVMDHYATGGPHGGSHYGAIPLPGFVMTQSVTTTGMHAGDTLTVSFWYQGVAQVSFGSSTFTSPNAALGWTQASLSYTLQSDNEPVSLSLGSNSLGGTEFDDVSIACPSASTPTPSPTAAPSNSVLLNQGAYTVTNDGSSTTAILTITLTGQTPITTVTVTSVPEIALNAISAVSSGPGVNCMLPTNDDASTLSGYVGANILGGTCTVTFTLSTTFPVPTLYPSGLAADVGGIGVAVADESIVSAPSPTATLEPTATPSDTPTLVPTETTTPTATTLPTNTPTTVPTDTPTASPTGMPTSTTVPTATTVPTSIPTSTTAPSPTVVPSSTVAPSPTPLSPTSTMVRPTPTVAMPTGTVVATGSVELTVSTADGGAVPDDTTVCVGTTCQRVGAGASAAAISPATLTFSDLAPGTYGATVTNAAPYQDAASSVTVTADETTSREIVLQMAAVTVAPTEPGAATPIATGTTVPANPPSGGNGSGVAPSQPHAPSGGANVTSLPNTGAGSGSSSTSLLFLLLAMATVLGAGLLSWRRRRGL
jgi:LPXTG-motif cell wall-anchored protein